LECRWLRAMGWCLRLCHFGVYKALSGLYPAVSGYLL
jgi:hypothetical protein